MKLGLAERHQQPPPLILVLGEGALASQFQSDLDELGLNSMLVEDLPLSDADKVLPRVTDPDAGLRFKEIFKAFKTMEKGSQFEHSWVHPGTTVWGERAEFESWARQSGMNAVSAPARALQLFWNTHQLLSRAATLDVPTLVIQDDPVASVREIEQSVKKLFQSGQATLPFVLKSAYRVRGGYAHRVIRNMDELNEWVPIWMDHIQENSGASLLFIERYLEGARCYVQPFVRTRSGETQFFPVIDASLMFEGKNWVEVCPAQSIDEYLQAKIEDYSQRILDDSNFVGVGNLIYLSDGVEVFLTEGLARPNFAYRLWERVAGTKALHWQIHALAPALVQNPPEVAHPQSSGNSLICGLNIKLYSEDTALKIPSPGKIHSVSQKREWNSAQGEAEFNWDVEPGDVMDWRSNGALGLATVFASDWKSVLAMSRQVLSDLWVSGGIQTNERFLAELLAHPWVEESMFYTGFVDEEFIPRQLPDRSWLQILANSLDEVTPDLRESESWIWMNHRLPRPEGKLEWIQKDEFDVGAQRALLGNLKDGNGKHIRICVFPVSESRYMIRLSNWFFSVRRSEKGRPLQLMALTSGRIHSIFFQKDAIVDARQTVLILESQQCLISHRLPISVRIKKLNVKAEDEVILGQSLAELERLGDT